MNVSWIKGKIEPPSEGEYYTICEAKQDFSDYEKRDVTIGIDFYSKDIGWNSIGRSNRFWEVLAWANVPMPNVPKGVNDRLVTYFGVDVRKKKSTK